MKSKLLTLLLIWSSFSAHSQNYIWFKDKKQPISYHPTVVTFKYEGDLQLKDFARKLGIDEKKF